jgi:hypothetical protein
VATSKQDKTLSNRGEDEMQIRQPDLRIVPRNQDQNNSRTGPGPKANHHKLPAAAWVRQSTAAMPENKNMRFKLIADEVHPNSGVKPAAMQLG